LFPLEYLAPIAGVLALAFAFVLINRVNSADPGTENMQEIAAAIQEGAMAFLKRQYTTLIVFVNFSGNHSSCRIYDTRFR